MYTAQFITYKTKPCIVCKQESKLILSIEGYVRWSAGRSVQDAFPKMSASRRELLISGIHPKCWETIFPEEEDD